MAAANPAVLVFSRLFDLTYEDRKALKRIAAGKSANLSAFQSLSRKGLIQWRVAFITASGTRQGDYILTERGCEVHKALTSIQSSDTYDDA